MTLSRYLGIDYGDRRIGLAISDPFGQISQPLATVANTLQWPIELKRILSEYDIAAFVVGLPRNQHGADSLKAKSVREFAAQLETHFCLPVRFWDERYSTASATKTLIQANVRRDKRKTIIDQQAACFILQGFLDSNGRIPLSATGLE